MKNPTQRPGLAAYRLAQHEHAALTREAMAVLAELTAEKAHRRLQAGEGGDAASAAAQDRKITALEDRQVYLRERLNELVGRLANAREQVLGGESGFEKLSIAHPLLMLPVRLETRFAWMNGGVISFTPNTAYEQVLLVRIYPDEIHEDSHEPELTEQEARWINEFRKKLLAARDNLPIREAWSELIGRSGDTRAAWLGQVAISGLHPGKRPSVFSRPPLVKLLPDRWVAYATLPDGTTLTALSGPLVEPLEAGLSPGGVKWMTDFDAALKTGMALVVRAVPATVNEIRRLVVVGARSTLDPAQSQAELEQLLSAHRYTRGLSLLVPGTPTNSSPDARAGFSTRPELAGLIAIEERRYRVGGRSEPLCQRGDRSDGTALADALGIDAACLAYVSHADSTGQLDGQMLRSILVAATRRPLTHLMDGVLDVKTLDELHAFAIECVSALGPLPSLRVGSQPYGVLPVMLTADKDMQFPAGSFPERSVPVLARLRAVWEQAASGLDRVGKAGADPGQTLVRILQRDGVAGRIAFRPVIGPQLAAALDTTLSKQAAATLRKQRKAAASAIDALGARRSGASALLRALHLPSAPPLTDPVVQAEDLAPGSVQRVSEYLELIAVLSPDRLLQHDYNGRDRPRALLFAIARLAMLELADARAREMLVADGNDPALWDDEDVPSIFRDALGTPLRRLQAADPADPIESIAFHLSELGRDAGVLGGMRQALRWLKTCPPHLLEVQLRASIGLFSNRLDAWFTALATERLRALRNQANAASGVHVGAYGVLENIARAPRQSVAAGAGLYTNPVNGGYVHAPSVNQAVAAAVLRSVHLAHAAAGHGAAFAVDLSSERVRRALALLEGIREGQPLAALLGYRIERALSEERLQRFIAPLRSVAPLLANRLTPSALPAENVAANNVVDGLTLLEMAGYDGHQDAAVSTLWQHNASLGAMPGGDDYAALQRVLDAAQDAVDAVSDLVLAESVYQAVQGNPARAGAAADSISGAPVPPSEANVMKSSRSGVATTHRLVVLLGTDTTAATVSRSWAGTARAIAEPRLEAWCADTLPDPAHVRLQVRFRASDGSIAASRDDLTLGELLQAAESAGANHLLLGALDVVALANPSETPQKTGFEVRLAALVELQRPEIVGEAALELVYERPEAWTAAEFGIVEMLEIAAQLRDLIGHARAMVPSDLALPGQPPVIAIDAQEHARRAQNAANGLIGVQTALAALTNSSDTAALRVVLFAADALGVAGAAPTWLRDATDGKAQAQLLKQLQLQASAVLAELARRVKRFGDAPADDPAARLKAIFGEPFLSLPLLVNASDATAPFAKAPMGASAPAVRTWLARATRVREGARLLDGVLSCAEAVAHTRQGGVLPNLSAGQLGGTATEPWIALPLAPNAVLPGGRVSLVAVSSSALPNADIAGLFVDEWVEVVPSRAETTSVAFHYDAPSSAPAQVMLLAVPHPGMQRWTANTAQQLVAEALALGRLRLVDMDDVPALGQLLPAFVTAENPAGEVNALDVETLTNPGAA